MVKERSHSGLVRRTRNAVRPQGFRGFESHPLRQDSAIISLMGKGLIAFLIAVGATAWIYNRFMRTTGNLTQRSFVAAALSGIVIFLAALIILGFIF